MELVRHATVFVVKLGRGSGRRNDLARCDVEREVFPINVLLRVCRVFGYASRLYTLRIFVKSYRFD